MSLGGSRAAVALAELTPNCVFETRHEDGDCGEDVEGDEDHEDVQASQITHQFMFTPSPPPAHLVLSLHHSRGSVPDTPAILPMHIYLKQSIVLLISGSRLNMDICFMQQKHQRGSRNCLNKWTSY